MNRNLPLSWAALAALASIGCGPSAQLMALPGDVDGNGVVDIWDARSLERSLTSDRFHVLNPEAGDVSQNGELDHGDLEALAKLARGQSTVSVVVGDAEDEPVTLGGVETIRVADTFLPMDVQGGTIRITSAAADYDSGTQPLSYAKEGRSLMYHWDTSGLRPANDFMIEVRLDKNPSPAAIAKAQSAGDNAAAASIVPTAGEGDAAEPAASALATSQVVEARAQVQLLERPAATTRLVQSSDLALPFWGMGLELTRRYHHGPMDAADAGGFGRGWTHPFAIELVEHTDGMVEVRGGGPAEVWFRRVAESQYEAIGPVEHRLFRDPDGTFQLALAAGDVWLFNASLTPVSVHDGHGNAIHLFYDDDKRLVEAVDDAGQFITLAYDADGRIAAASDSTGRRVEYEYRDDQLVAVRGPATRQSRYRYDNSHRLVGVESTGGVWQTLSYDEHGRVAAIDGPEQRDVRYAAAPLGLNPEPAAASTEVTGSAVPQPPLPGDGIRPVGYEATSSLVQPASYVVTSEPHVDFATSESTPLAASIAVRRSPEENKIVYTDGNAIATTVRHLDTGEPTHIVMADGTTEIREYAETDEIRYVKRRLRGKQATEYWFDVRGLLQTVRQGSGQTSHYRYDASGNLLRAINAWGEIAFEYDDACRMVACTYPGGRTFRYEYDEAGRRTAMVDPDGVRLDYEYDERGRVTSIAEDGQAGTQLVQYLYGSGPEPTDQSLGNGVTASYDYQNSRVTAIEWVGPDGQRPLGSHRYNYDDVGRRVGYESQSSQLTFGYDAIGQLQRVSGLPGGELEITYDAASNRVEVRHGERAERYAANVLNQYSVAGDTRFTYDLNGNLNVRSGTDGKTVYEYDLENRLVRVRLPDRGVVSYEYDPLGRLASRTHGSLTTRYLWDGDRLAIAEDTQYRTLQRFVWGREFDELVAFRGDGPWYYCGRDAIRSVTDVYGPAGESVARIEYGPFGTPAGGQGVAMPFRFAGSYHDPLTGLHFMRNRWYDAREGSFLQPHPAMPFAAAHPYAYAGNDPINRTVPRGLIVEDLSPSPPPGTHAAVDLSPRTESPSRPWLPLIEITLNRWRPEQLAEWGDP